MNRSITELNIETITDGLTIEGNLGVSGHINLINESDVFKINNQNVLSSNTLGSTILNSSLTNVGTLTQLNVSGSAVFQDKLNVAADLSQGANFKVKNLTGYVGIGSDNPGNQLDILSSLPRMTLFKSTFNGGAYIEVMNNAGTRTLYGCDGAGLFGGSTLDTIFGNWTSGGKIHFVTNYLGTPTKYMTLNSSGNLGIGSLTPTEKLDIVGNANVSGTTTSDINIGVTGSFTNLVPTDYFRCVVRNSEPTTSSKGDLYFWTDTNKLRVYDGTSWVDLH